MDCSNNYRFQQAIVTYGVNKADIFQTNDLSEKKDLGNVTNTLFALGRAVSTVILSQRKTTFEHPNTFFRF